MGRMRPAGAGMKSNRVAVVAALVLSVIFTVSCGETFRPVATPVFSNGGDPQNQRFAVVISENVANNTQVGLGTQINVSGDTVASQVTLGRGSNHAALFGNAVFSANSLEPSTSKYFASFALTFPATTATLSGNPTFMFANATTVYGALKSANKLSIITPGTGFETNAVDLSPSTGPVAISTTLDGSKVYVVNQGSGTVTVVNSDTSIAKTISVGANPCCIVRNASGSHMYVVNSGSANVSVIDTTQDIVTAIIPVGSNPTFAIFEPTALKLYVANTGSSSISVISGATALPPVAVAGAPVAIAPLADGTRYYVAFSNLKTVSVMSALNNTQLRAVSVGPVDTATAQTTANQSFYIAASPDSSKVYVANLSTIQPLPSGTAFTNGNVSIIKTSDDTIAGTVTLPTGQVPKFILMTP
jgi:YVTN family beta-propeller protein